MMTNWVSINGCRHFIANEAGSERLFFSDTRFLCEVDSNTKHPLGMVYKAKGVLDTNVRFIIQPDRSLLFFNLKEWERSRNPFNTIILHTFVADCKKLLNFLKRLKSGNTKAILFG